MMTETKTREEKIEYLKENARHMKIRTAMIYGSYGLRENYSLSSNGTILARPWGTEKGKYRLSVEEFAEKFGDEGLDHAIKMVKLRIRDAKTSP